MINYLKSRFTLLVAPTAALMLGMSAIAASAQSAAMYNPGRLPASNEVTDTLTDQDIPTGAGGFARDYQITLQAGDQMAVDLTSDQFDALLTLLGPDGAPVGENDDGPDGTTNSLLYARISTAGNYTLRVRAYGGQGTGSFNLKVTRLRPV